MDEDIKAAIEQTKAGAAALAALIVRSLAASDPTSAERIANQAEILYRDFEDRDERHACDILLFFRDALAKSE